MLRSTMPAPSGALTIVKHPIEPHIQAARDGRIVRDDVNGHFWARREGLLLENKRLTSWQQEVLAWLRDHVHRGIPRTWYRWTIGHDLHLSIMGELYAQHFHTHERDPFTGEMGWLENKGLVSPAKVTTAFRNFVTAQLVTETSVFGDFKYHEVGTDATAEANSQTALIVTSGIARVAGTQVDGTGTYSTVGTVTADATETWQEHGLFNASSGVTLLDRSIMTGSPASVSVVSLDTCTFTHVTTFNAES